MNKPKALKLAKDLKGKKIGNWLLGEYINNGKSAFVCKCEFENKPYAIKVYDDDLIDEVGKNDVELRINRQLFFKDKHHKNLVKVFDGGYCTDFGIHYLVMEYLDQKNLTDAIGKIPDENKLKIIEQLVDAVRFLEDHRTYHRDIKPDNIVINSNFENIKLLDLGVIKPIEKGCESSGHPKLFLGTLQYSPKEYWLGEVEDSNDGWKAVTYYQIGAVIYDIMEERQLFEEYKNHRGKLSNAVCFKEPLFEKKDIPIPIEHLIKKCLSKDYKFRLKALSWDDFYNYEKNIDHKIQDIRKRINERIEMKSKIEVKDEKPKVLNTLYKINEDFDKIFYKICKSNINISPFINKSEAINKTLKKLIFFNESNKFSLLNSFSLTFDITLVDLSTKYVEIKFCAQIPGAMNFESCLGKFVKIYSDVFNEDNFSNVFENYFLLSYDEAQSLDSNLKKPVQIIFEERIK
jgi:eukaryotic-like serine/threonine-protein kinase